MNPRIKLKLGRVEHNLTQAELAAKVDVTRQTIGLIENGGYNPTLHLCIAIVNLIVFFTLFFIMGQIHSVVDVGVFLISFLLGLGLVIGIAHCLTRRWKRKAGIEDEK